VGRETANQIQTLSEDLVFNNPAVYDSLLRSYYDPIQKQNVLVAALTPFNLASSHYQHRLGSHLQAQHQAG
jgi:iron complex outermembrane receptor protein